MKYSVLVISVIMIYGCTSKSKLIVNKWLVVETEVADQKLSGQLVEGFYLDIYENGNYNLVGMEDEKGVWQLKNDSLITINEEKRTAVYYIKALSKYELILFDNSVGANTTTSFKSAN